MKAIWKSLYKFLYENRYMEILLILLAFFDGLWVCSADKKLVPILIGVIFLVFVGAVGVVNLQNTRE